MNTDRRLARFFPPSSTCFRHRRLARCSRCGRGILGAGRGGCRTYLVISRHR